MPLSDIAIRKAKPTGKVQRMFDGGGLYLEVSPAGGKWWRYKYRILGKEKRLSFGTYPDVSLASARDQHADARKQVAAGIDPSAHRKAVKAAGKERAANSFETIAREWFAKKSPKLVEDYSAKVLARLEGDVFPMLGRLPIAGITSPDVLKAMRRIEDRGAFETAHRTLQTCGQVFRYAIASGRAAADPTIALRGALTPATGTHHAAITAPEPFGGLLRALDGYDGSAITKYALQLAPLVFVRPGELRHAEWSEFDLEARVWCIPAAKMKMRDDHIVPLSRQALAILEELHEVTGGGLYIFPSARTSRRPMSNNTLNAALRRLGYDKEAHTAHGFRASARTLLDEVLHYRPDYIEHQLAHTVRDPNGRAYNRTAHLPERHKMMQAWADYLDLLRQGRDGAVVPIRKRKAG
ncbi:integrase arm-type DNA-binding domain-containing protein [Luteimonas sp. BDR2-5]|uniref:tyrosine-type recombinase/integrase n=1 Tax=Proluteimonas luteida TaxID=2878685 RepID=UPI001E331C0F|nr:integrase arm-type DNA-binding domain-containing protein [Luteimonas sp. BDR2-5]MCD9029397.1 integrase arm-type DNA-binding domain-containing protein [Luteimonas sp. BDR2-5]